MTTNEQISLSQLKRIMDEDPREMMRAGILDWAIETLARRVEMIPSGTPAHERYSTRLHILRYVKENN